MGAVKDDSTILFGDTGSSILSELDPEVLRGMAHKFNEENNGLFDTLIQRLILYVKNGDAIGVHWFCNNLIQIAKMGNKDCLKILREKEKAQAVQ
ncbi:MAG: hypothetical protein AVO38_08305 [delta proteobacterium ML8_D]|nr:MAG: hypothetical protein AVO38_08305 [delta proteobacterium ML8_D]